jgi:hypothetical protein
MKAAREMIRRQFEKELAEAAEPKALGAGATTGANQAIGPATADVVPEHHVVVAKIEAVRLKSSKLRDVVEPLKGVINTALPLILSPALYEARAKLLIEFPYAIGAVDAALSDLVGRSIVKLRPLLLVGEPGGGKSRFVRRLGDVLGVSVWRADASRSDGAVFAGTDKRWYSAEPCHPLLAINRARHANPIVLLDELEKAGTRTDYGRLWDCLLGFLEPETNSRYPDPALQVELDLSHVSYLATANSIDLLPSPLRDRFRIIAFPKPTRDHLEALLPSLIADFAHQHDARWISPLDGTERAAIEDCWAGGSVRRLRRIVEAVLRDRDARATRN